MQRVLRTLTTVKFNATDWVQLNYSVSNAKQSIVMYTNINNSGALKAMANIESGNSSVSINIGFDFNSNFNGSVFTQCMIHADGILRFESMAPGSHTALFTNSPFSRSSELTSTYANCKNLVFALLMDLMNGRSVPAYHQCT